MNFKCESKGLGHRFQNKFLFRNLSFQLEEGRIALITGLNGSGKSTLLRIISGALEPIEGKIEYSLNNKFIELEDVWQEIAFVSPYQELPEELTLSELINFQKSICVRVDRDTQFFELAQLFGIEKHLEKPIRFFSTGMKQKARFILGLGSGRPIWLLDEPTSNLDSDSVSKFWKFVQDHKMNRLVVVATNDPGDLTYLEDRIDLLSQ